MADKKSSKNKTGAIRSLVIGILIGISGGILLSGNLLFWTGNNLVDNNKFTALTSPLIKHPDIQRSIAKYGTDQLFNNVDVQGYIGSVLPPKASFLAPTLASQLKTLVNQQLQKSLSNPKVQDIWNNSLSKTHNLVINAATNYKGNGTIDLGELFGFATNNLKDTKLSFLSDKKLPSNIGQIQIIKASWLPVVHNVVVNIRPFEYIMTILFAATTAAAIWISKNRRNIIIKISLLYSGLMLATIIGLRLSKILISSNVSPDYSGAAMTAHSLITKSFYIQSMTILVLGIIVALIAWLSGNYKSSKKVKDMSNKILSGNVHKAIFKKENSYTVFISKYKKVLNWSVVIIAATLLCFVGISLAVLGTYLLIVLLIIIVVEISSTSTKS